MKFQALHHLKTKSKLLKMCDTLQEAKLTIENLGARYEGLSYYGGFPSFSLKDRMCSIQGAHFINKEKFIVCSIPAEEIEKVF